MKRISYFCLIALVSVLHGCAVIAPADNVTGNVLLERHSKASVDALIIDGKTKLSEIIQVLGPPKQTPESGKVYACTSNAKISCTQHFWTFNRINYADRQLTLRGISALVVQETGVVDGHSYTGYNKTY